MTVADAPQPSLAPPHSRAGLIFLLLGVVILGVTAATILRWVAGPDFHPTPVGPDPAPPWRASVLWGVQAFGAAMSVTWLWFVVIDPWRRRGELSWDGMLTLACFSMWIQDPMCNYFVFTFAYDAHLLNYGSWSVYIPGWQSPLGGRLPEPLLLSSGVYLWFCALNVIVFCKTVHWLRVRAPSRSLLVLSPLGFLTLVTLDLLLQLPATRWESSPTPAR